jgi:hypothetical protein
MCSLPKRTLRAQRKKWTRYECLVIGNEFGIFQAQVVVTSKAIFQVVVTSKALLFTFSPRRQTYLSAVHHRRVGTFSHVRPCLLYFFGPSP